MFSFARTKPRLAIYQRLSRVVYGIGTQSSKSRRNWEKGKCALFGQDPAARVRGNPVPVVPSHEPGSGRPTVVECSPLSLDSPPGYGSGRLIVAFCTRQNRAALLENIATWDRIIVACPNFLCRHPPVPILFASPGLRLTPCRSAAARNLRLLQAV